MSEPTPIPKAPPAFKGIINLRGQVISVVDLRAKLELPEITNGPKTAIIILDLVDKVGLGVIVDRINSVQAFHSENISPAPESHAGSERYLAGVARRDKSMTLILNIQAALSMDEIEAAKTQTAQAS